jgi:glutathione S-transferase
VLAEQPAVAADLARITGMWQAALAASGGPFLFGSFGAADIFYAPVVARLRIAAAPVDVLPSVIAAATEGRLHEVTPVDCADALCALPALRVVLRRDVVSPRGDSVH